MSTHSPVSGSLNTSEPGPEIEVDDDDELIDQPLPLRPISSTFPSAVGRNGQRVRHTKKLSLSFPIAISNNQCQNSPLSSKSAHSAPLGGLTSRDVTPYLAQHGFPSPPEREPMLTDSDFLTLIASQERRVLELKEELEKAEAGLVGLKKQWATFEARKKGDELRNKSQRLGSVSSVRSVRIATPASGEGGTEEKSRREELRRKRMQELGLHDNELGRSNTTPQRRNGQRVFTGRHARTLSLLQPHMLNVEAQPKNSQTPPTGMSAISQIGGRSSRDARRQFHDQNIESESLRPSIKRQSTLQELLMNPSPATLNKTYKEIAEQTRNSLPPGTDLYIKHGRQVYDGVAAGFWGLVEDIRQVTVGEDPVPEDRTVKKKPSQRRLQAQSNKLRNCEKHGKTVVGRTQLSNGDVLQPEKDSFWNEFGLDTPKSKPKSTAPPTKSLKKGNKSSDAATKNHDGGETSSGDHESHSSTDSRHPPSLLDDLVSTHEEDDLEMWDKWSNDSPVLGRSQIHKPAQSPPKRQITSGTSNSIGRVLGSKSSSLLDDLSDLDVTFEHVQGSREFVSKKRRSGHKVNWVELAT